MNSSSIQFKLKSKLIFENKVIEEIGNEIHLKMAKHIRFDIWLMVFRYLIKMLWIPIIYH